MSEHRRSRSLRVKAHFLRYGHMWFAAAVGLTISLVFLR